MSPRASENVAIWIVVCMAVGVGRYRDNIERCYGDEPCPFGPGIVGSRKCRGGQLAEKCNAPDRRPRSEPTKTDTEVIQGIVREEMRRSREPPPDGGGIR